MPRFTPEARKANQALVDPIGQLARNTPKFFLQCTDARLTLDSIG